MSLDGKQISELARVTSVRDDSLLVVDNGGTESNSVYVSDLLKKAGSDKQDKLTAGDNITIENNVISAPTINARNIGELVPSVLPLTDAGLHLLDGALISGNGIYGDFVDYVSGLYEENPTASYFAQPGAIISEWTQPHLVSIGTMGGATFACYSDVPQISGTSDYWQVFNNISQGAGFHSAQGNVTGNIYWYNPIPLNITNIKVYTQIDAGGSNRQSTAGTIYGSNDYTNWTPISTYTNTQQAHSSSWDINLSSNTGYYKYYRWESTACGTGGYWTMSHLVFTATQKAQGTAEDSWQHTLTTYGSCGKFVYDSVHNTVRLPKIFDIIQGTSDINALGSLVEAGLPNIEGEFKDDHTILKKDNSTNSGAIKSVYSQNVGRYGNSIAASEWGYGFVFDASNSNPIYGKSDTVQPQTIKVLFYIVVANSSRKDIGVNTEKNIVDNNLKADKDFSNVVLPNQNFIQKSISWGIPDYNRGITLNYTTLQNFKAPSAGIICGMTNPAGSVSGRVYVNGHMVWGGDTYVMSIHIVLDRNDIVTYSGIDNDSYTQVYFYPFKGAY